MKKNGFTLIEVLVSIALIGILSVLAISTNFSLKKNAEEKIYQEKMNSIETAAVLWAQDHSAMFSVSNCTVGSITYEPSNEDAIEYTCYSAMTVQYLLDNKYIEADTDDNKISDPRDKTIYLNNDKIIIYHYFSNYYAEYQTT